MVVQSRLASSLGHTQAWLCELRISCRFAASSFSACAAFAFAHHRVATTVKKLKRMSSDRDASQHEKVELRKTVEKHGARVEELKVVLHIMAADVAGTDDVLQRALDMDPAARQAFLAQLDDAESKVVEQLNTTLSAARVKPGRTPLSCAVIGATPELCNSTRSLTGFKSYSRLTRFIVAIKSFMTKYGIPWRSSGTAQSDVVPSLPVPPTLGSLVPWCTNRSESPLSTMSTAPVCSRYASWWSASTGATR
jgi:hypothetical protein